jgi:hypothetical protein
MTQREKDHEPSDREKLPLRARPFLSIVIPWKDRPELALSLAHNRPIFRSYNAEVSIANCGGDLDLLHRITAREEAIINVGSLPGIFNKPYASNVGAYCSHGDRIFFLDADVLLHVDTLPQMLSALEHDSMVTVSRVKECSLDEPEIDSMIRSEIFSESKSPKLLIQFEIFWPDGTKTVTEDVCIDVESGDCSGPGLALLWRSDFLAVEGFSSIFSGWGFEDTDLIIRLQKKLGVRHERRGTVHHLKHGDEKRVSFGKPLTESSGSNVIRGLERYMNGDELGSLSSDVERWRQATASTSG